MNKTVVVELDQNGKEIFHTAGYEKYWISRVGMETVWLRKERVKEVVSVQETFAAMEFLEKPERGIVSAEISIRMKMTDESCRWTRVGYEIMMPDNGTDKKVVVTFTDEEKEKQSEAEYAEVIRERDNLILTISGGIAIYEITDKIRTVYITEETAALAGYTKKELMEIIGENALALCHPDDIKTTQNYFKTRRQQVRVMSYEYRIKNKNGVYQWVSVRARFVQQKNSILLYTIMTDIDQIKKAEEDARMQKKMLELALQQSDFRFWDYDIKTHRLYRSWAVTQQVGFGEYEENVPEGFVELGLIHPDDCEAYLEFYHNVQQGKNQRLTFRAIHQNGEWGWMDIAYRVFFNEQGEPVRAIGVGGDVSKQREKEQKYLKDFELFRDVSIYAIQRVFLDVFLVDIPTDSIRLVLAQGGYMNMKEIQGYDKILNQKLCRYVRDKEEAVKKLSIAQIKKNIALTKDHKLEYTFELRNEKGRKCWYKYYISYFHENTEKLLVLVKDVTNTTRLEDEKRLDLETALLQAKKANDAKKAFLSNMSHDIRTPMNVITNMAKMVLEEPENKTQVLDYMNKICSMSTFLMGVISDILDVSKMESGKLQLRKEPYSCIELHDAVCAMMEPLCREKNITFYTNLNPQNDIIFTDKTKLNRIFFNLLGNAVKFTPAGGKVSFLHKNIVRKDGFLEWDTVITDTGSGMSKEFQRKMYQPFEQENQLVTDSLAGVGLGLAIVKMNTEAFGGTIAVESEPGKGTAFTIHLKAPYMSGEDYHMHYTASKLQTDLAGKKILLVEDHKLNMEIAKKILEKKQMKVTCAYNGAEAVALFEKMPEYTFDAVIMDIRMPVMNGLEAAAAIRAGAKADAKTIPIIAMSANAFAEDMEKSRRAGMNRHVAKPVEPERLVGVLSEIFSD